MLHNKKMHTFAPKQLISNNMKKFYNYTAALCMALMTMMLTTSCDDDTALAYDLDGVWQGTIIGDYYYDRYGTNSNDYSTEIMFRKDGGHGGTGYEIDRRSGSRHETKVEFDWNVRNGRIYIDYDDGYHVIIRDYETFWMGSFMHLRGYFDNYDTGEQMASFDLIKVVSNNSYDDRDYSRAGTPADSIAN